ncbi:DUF4384 domain-containing protein [Fischerella sp. PCC 9605]|uniref:DUF4384 domain-containing protein n=1 Tax=Fischerella sp. PCC 9605 TaxID=1173024 RepID=UPI0004BB8FA7|nr:DUF4384 domain-containing protein [Fischerella sp. PCC 9605]
MTESNFEPITAVIKVSAGAATSPIKNKLERSEIIIKALKKLGFEPEHPPADFTGVYQYALVEYGVDKPEPILQLFRQKEIVQAFRQAFEQNERSSLPKPVEDFLDWNILGDQIRELKKINIRQEFANFKAVFINVANRTRNPAEVIRDQKIDDLQKKLDKIQQQLDHYLAHPPLTLNELWQELKAFGFRTDKMGVVLVQEETLGMWTPQSTYPKLVSLGSRIRFELNIESTGYLLLLEKNTSGEVWCLCPSFLAPQPYLSAGKNSLPQQDAPITSFQLEGAPGLEQILAVMSKEAPSIKWLPQGSDEPLQLNEGYLIELLKYVNQSEDCKVLYTEYTVTA